MRLGQKHLLRAALSATAVVLLAGTAACSSASGGSAAGTSSGPSTKATVYVIVPIDTPDSSHPGVLSGAQAAALDINNSGGVNGTGINIVYCNDESDPNIAASCARKAVSAHAVAAVVLSLYSSNIDPILATAHVPALVSPQTQADWTNSDAFPIGGGPAGDEPGLGTDMLAQKLQIKKLGVITFEAPPAEASAQLIQQGAKAAGGISVDNVTVPLTVSDYTPYLEQLQKFGAQAIAPLTTPAGALQAMATAKQLGMNVDWLSSYLTFGSEQLKQAAQSTDELYVLSAWPPTNLSSEFPGIARFDSEMTAAGKAGIANADVLDETTIFGWSAVHAIAAAAAKVTVKPLTSDALLQVLNSATNLNVGGLFSWSPSDKGPSDFPRVSYPYAYILKNNNGSLEAVDKTPVNVFDALGISH